MCRDSYESRKINSFRLKTVCSKAQTTYISKLTSAFSLATNQSIFFMLRGFIDFLHQLHFRFRLFISLNEKEVLTKILVSRNVG